MVVAFAGFIASNKHAVWLLLFSPRNKGGQIGVPASRRQIHIQNPVYYIADFERVGTVLTFYS